MKFKKNNFEGLLTIEPEYFDDSRGYFSENFRLDKLEKMLGYSVHFCQENSVFSKKLVLRGLHFQTGPSKQCKLVSVVSGSITDVVVDLRKKSKTYSKYFKIFLSENNKKQIFIPAGFAHGYITHEPKTIVHYKVDNYYNPKFEDGIIYNDKTLNIDWGEDESKLIISKKDKNLSKFRWQEI